MDDVAGQTGMLVSPRTWRELIKPVVADIFAVGKAAGLWVAFHCRGALRPIIPPETSDPSTLAMYEEAGISRTEILDQAAAIWLPLREDARATSTEDGSWSTRQGRT
jgi:hypothetical protein